MRAGMPSERSIDHRAGVVIAVAFLAVEKEIIHPVAAVWRRLDVLVVGVGAQVRLDGLSLLERSLIRCSHLGGQVAHARRQGVGQLEIPFRHPTRIRHRIILHQILHRRRAECRDHPVGPLLLQVDAALHERHQLEGILSRQRRDVGIDRHADADRLRRHEDGLLPLLQRTNRRRNLAAGLSHRLVQRRTALNDDQLRVGVQPALARIDIIGRRAPIGPLGRIRLEDKPVAERDGPAQGHGHAEDDTGAALRE